jgi:hypothetical protein
MKEMNIQIAKATDSGFSFEVIECAQMGLIRPPVIFIPPELNHFFES